MKIFYDGDCYFCTNYVALLNLRAVVGEVELISLRESNEDTKAVFELGYDVNTGFVVEQDGVYRHGSEAFHYLNSLVEPQNGFNRFVRMLSRNRAISYVTYPILVVCRYLILILQGGALIDSALVRQPPGSTSALGNAEGLAPRGVRLAAGFLMLVCLLIAWRSEEPLYLAFGAVFLVAYGYLFIRQAAAQKISNSLRQGSLLAMLTYVAAWILIINSGDLISHRRLFGFGASLPALGILLDLFLERRSERGVGNLPALLPAALLIFCFVPGFYFPPYFGGIAGWTLEFEDGQPVSVSGVRLVNDAGEEIWHNPAFLQPHTLTNRFQMAFLRSGRTKQQYLQFLFENYQKIYPTLTSGRLPHQAYLGNFAYPTHNMQKNNALDYVDRFNPDRVVELKYYTENYTWDRKLLSIETGDSIRVSK